MGTEVLLGLPDATSAIAEWESVPAGSRNGDNSTVTDGFCISGCCRCWNAHIQSG